MEDDKTAPEAPRAPDQRDQEIEATSCVVLSGHQHAVADVEDLADSIATLGQLNPVQVLEYPDGRRFIAAGRRRWMACKMRGLPMRADIWLCKANEDINSENLARAMRIAENTERKDPSAVDIAFQLRRIRNEKNFTTYAELSRFVGMSESRVKRYLCVLKASDFLMETARAKALPIKTVAELMRCEKHLGERATRKYVRDAGEGTLSARDLKRLRGKGKAPKRVAPKPNAREIKDDLEAKGEAFLALVAKHPASAYAYCEAFKPRLAKLTRLQPPPGFDSSPG